MDYEKAYKAVLKTATQWIKDGCTDKEKICLECVFPELRESEDERIRKAIVHLLEAASEAYLIEATGFKKEQFLSYLEKQKELPFVKDVMLGYPGLYFYDGERMHFRGPAMEEKQKEQKHVEVRTPTDEEIEEARKQLHKFKVFVVKMADKHQVCFSYDHDFEWDNFCGEFLYYLNGNQKPVEWSEEDENRLNAVVELLENTSAIHPNYSRRKLIIWLKSLRPQPHWKPSEEQMDALKELIDDANKAGWVTPGATELYEQLKKL